MEINATNLSQEKLKSKAVMFCGDFGKVDEKTISKIVEDFKKEHNRVVANVTNSIFEQMGGQEGKMRGRRDVPPTTYFPEDEDLLKMIQNDTIHQKKCVICNVILFSRDEVTNHIHSKHEVELKKVFSKEVSRLVPFHQKYLSWLEEDHVVNTLAARSRKLSNQVEKRDSNEIEDGAYFKMNTTQNSSDDIIETQRTIIVPQKDETEKKSVVKYHLANVTTRPRSPLALDEVGGKRKNYEAEQKQAKKITNILEHISGNDENTQATLISKVIDKKGQNFADKVTLKSKELQECKKLSPEETAAFLSGANLPDNVLTKGITLFNKKWGRNPFASHKKVRAARDNILPINRFILIIG